MNNFDQQVKQLLNRMSIREKAGQCVMIEPVFCLKNENEKHPHDPYHSILDPRFLDLLFRDHHIGCLLFGGITRLGNDQLVDWAEHFETINRHINQLGSIPILYGVDAVHGVNFVKQTTIFPHNLGVAATWNPEVAESYMEIVGQELHTIGINLNFAPTIDLARDQRWGRVYETLGEDPYLASKLSKSLVTGMQDGTGVAACAKHFIGYGESNNGMDRTPADLSDRVLKELHQPPFIAAIEAGVKAIMVHGSDLNGSPMPASKRQMIHVLRDDLGFQGVTMSDWEDVARLIDLHRVARDYVDAVLKSFNAGLDMSMAVDRLDTVDIIEQLVRKKKISEDRLNQAVERILRLKMELGLFERKVLDPSNTAQRPFLASSKAIAQQVALESLTLLKNEANLLPLDPKQRLLVTGVAANSKRHMCGGWTLNWASAHEEDLDFPTILEVLQHTVSKPFNLTYAATLEELNQLGATTDDYDVIISVLGEEPHSEWLGDSFSMDIDPTEMSLLQAAHATGIPVVTVAVIGRPQQFSWIDRHIPAILYAWLPGSEGAQPIVDVLYGKETPSGKLPITFPRDGNQIPIVYNARKYHNEGMNTGYDPLYPFGYGLSYTTFAYSNLQVPTEAPRDTDVRVTVNIQNTGDVSGTDVIQLYLEDQFASVARPRKALKGFSRVKLEPGQMKSVEFLLTPEELGLFDETLQFVQEPRTIDVLVGTLRASLKIQ